VPSPGGLGDRGSRPAEPVAQPHGAAKLRGLARRDRGRRPLPCHGGGRTAALRDGGRCATASPSLCRAFGAAKLRGLAPFGRGRCAAR